VTAAERSVSREMASRVRVAKHSDERLIQTAEGRSSAQLITVSIGIPSCTATGV
jgi:hypothetical protein